MGDPERSVRGALVAGTNGKGSVIALAGSALRAAGYRVGETPKPHLVTYRERIVVDGRPIARGRLRAPRGRGAPGRGPHRAAPRPADGVRAADGGDVPPLRRGGPRRRPRRGGPGRAPGRHERLGRRRGGAHERRPRPHRPPGPDDRARSPARRPRSSSAATSRSPARTARRSRSCAAGARGWACRWPSRRPPRSWAGRGTRIAVELPRLGRDRASGCAAATRPPTSRSPTGCSTRSSGRGSPRSPPGGTAARATRPPAGRAASSWSRVGGARPGARREVLLDGAHNPDGAAALARALDDLRPYLAGGGESPPAPLTLVWASMADKDVAGVVAAAAGSRALAGATVVCTAVDLPARPARRGPGRGVAGGPPRRRRADRARPGRGARPRPARRAAGPVVVAGSLYLVGAARARLVDDPALRDPDGA